MATKKQNKRTDVRRTRRILNKALDFFSKVTGHRLHATRYGDGLHQRDVKESSK